MVAETDTYQAWLIGWAPGTGLGLHDHDGPAAGVHDLAPDHVHEVVSIGDDEAISVHVYSPRLADVRFRTKTAITP